MIPMSQIIRNQLLNNQTEKAQAEPGQHPYDSELSKVVEPRDKRVTSSSSTYDLSSALQGIVNSPPTNFASPKGSPKTNKVKNQITSGTESLKPSQSTKAISRQQSPKNNHPNMIASKSNKPTKGRVNRNQKSMQLDLNMVQSLKLLTQYQQ